MDHSYLTLFRGKRMKAGYPEMFDGVPTGKMVVEYLYGGKSEVVSSEVYRRDKQTIRISDVPFVGLTIAGLRQTRDERTFHGPQTEVEAR